MRKSSYLKTVLVLALAGTLFAGYLSAVKLFSGTCALNESCPYFLGYPSCWYGFAMFLIMLIASAAALLKKTAARRTSRVIAWVSAIGIIFAGSFVIQEIQYWLAGEPVRYTLGLPSCAYGLIFYIIIFILSLLFLRRKR